MKITSTGNHHQAARELESIADQLLQISRRQLNQSHQSIQNEWRGDASREFQGKARNIRSDIEGQAKRLRSLAEILRSAP